MEGYFFSFPEQLWPKAVNPTVTSPVTLAANVAPIIVSAVFVLIVGPMAHLVIGTVPVVVNIVAAASVKNVNPSVTSPVTLPMNVAPIIVSIMSVLIAGPMAQLVNKTIPVPVVVNIVAAASVVVSPRA